MGMNIGITVMGRPTAMYIENEDVATVRDAYNKLALTGEYTATISGSPATMDEELADGAFVVFSKATKGGSI